MGTSTELRLIQRFDGHGRIYDGDRLIDEASYALKEIEAVPAHIDPTGGNARAIEVQTLCGIVTPRRIELFAAYPGIRLKFELEDGRQFDFAVARVGDTFCLIKALSPPRPVDA